MRIAYLCSDFGIPIHGHKGASIHVRELSRALQRLGHEVVIFTPRRGGASPADLDLEVSELALEAPERQVFELLRDDPNAGESVAREIRAFLYATSLRHQMRGMLSIFRPDAIYERYSLLGSGGLTVAREADIPLILEVNAPLTLEHEAHRGLAFAQTARAIERAILCAADRTVAVSRPLAGWLEAIGVAPERIVVLPNGVDVERFAAAAAERAVTRAELGIGPDEPVVGFVGTLKPWHGTATLLHAVRSLRERGLAVRLLLVGDGPQRTSLEALAATEGIADATIFAGAVPHARIPGLLAAMDIATAPYDRSDGFYFSPLKLYEAMAAGRPIVAADIGQIAETIQDGVTGLLYPPGDAAGLAEAIAGLMADPDRAAALGRAARAEVRAGRTWEDNARAVIELIEQVRRRPAAGSTPPRAAPSPPAIAER